MRRRSSFCNFDDRQQGKHIFFILVMLTNDQDATKAPVNGMLHAVQAQPQIKEQLNNQVPGQDVDAVVTDTEIQSLPLDGFGENVQRYIENVAAVAGTSTDPVAAACLAVVGSVLANKRTAVLRGDDGNIKYNVVPNVFTCFVADASSGKTTAINKPTAPLKDIDKELYSQYKFNQQHTTDGDPEPRLQQMIINDTTPQAVIHSLHDNCNDDNEMQIGCLMVDDEMNGFFKQAADAKGTDFIKLLCKAFDGDAYKVDRVTSGKFIFNNFMLSFSGGIQTEMLKKRLNADMLASGFLQRFIWTFDDGQRRKVSRIGQDPQRAADWSNVINDIYHLAPQQAPFEFSTDATSLFWSWVDNCTDFAERNDDKNLSQFVAKHSYFVLRIALIFAVLHKQQRIERQDVADAIKVCNYCLFSDRILLGFFEFGENVSNLDQPAILHNLLQRCVAKDYKINLKDLSRVLGQNPNWASVKENQYKNRHANKRNGQTVDQEQQQQPQPPAQPKTSTAKPGYYSVKEFCELCKNQTFENADEAYEIYLIFAENKKLRPVDPLPFSKQVDKSILMRKKSVITTDKNDKVSG